MPRRGERRTARGLPVMREHRHGADVWVNQTTDALRRVHCICLDCALFKPGTPEHCAKAKRAYRFAVEENMAFMVTACPVWKPKASE